MPINFQSFKPTPPVFWISEIRFLSKLSADNSAEIRKIPLTTGLNIVWSEPGNITGPKSQRGRGHAAGKTSFCRAVRYILGEENFGNKFVEEKISNKPKLNNALIYASIFIGNTQWSVFRPLNKRFWQKQEFAVKDADFKAALSADSKEHIDYKDFLSILQTSVLKNVQVAHYDDNQNDPVTWLDVLMPLARDQEAHLSSLHNWRDKSATTTAQKFTPAIRAFLMRALMGIADAEETSQLQERAKHNRTVSSSEQTINTYKQVVADEIQRIEDGLRTKFEFPEQSDLEGVNSLFVESVRNKALEAAQAKRMTINREIEDLKIPDLEESIQKCEKDIARIEGRVEEPLEHLQSRKNFLNTLQSNKKTDQPAEPSLKDKLLRNISLDGKHCKVPIDTAQSNCPIYGSSGKFMLREGGVWYDGA